ncbi:hypothetical protein ACHAWF_014546 [Thalassiosira exigua]
MFAHGMKNIVGQEMVKERDKLERKILSLKHKLNKATVAREQSNSSSWADDYTRWDCYEDVEDLEVEIKEAENDLCKLNEKIKLHNSKETDKECGHSYRCSCTGDKSAERAVIAMPTSQRLDQMALFKKQGNDLYAQNEYGESLVLYEKSLIYFEYCFDGTQEERMRADTLRLQCLLNAASCFLHLKLYPRCIEYCNEALQIRPSTKAWFRRSRAHRLQGKFDIAEADLAKASNSLGSNSSLRGDIQREMRLLKEDQRTYQEALTKFAKTSLSGCG